MNHVITIAEQFSKTAKIIQLLLVITLLLFSVGVSLPILTITKLLIVSNEVSILTGLFQLIEEQQYFIFIVIFLFSIALPLLKLYYLYLLSARKAVENRKYSKYLHLMHLYGRWSMLDVFVIAILIMTVKLGALASVQVESGMFFFTTAVILLMMITSVMVKLESKLALIQTGDGIPQTYPEPTRDHHPKRALWWYVASLLVICFGSFMAAQYYPGGFDWFYTVASALASQKHNPTGGVWFAASLSLSMLLLWLYVSSIKANLSAVLPAAGFAVTAIRFGLLCGFLLGAERLLIHDLSQWGIYKPHESLALFTLLGLYVGILGLLLQFIHLKKSNIFIVLLIVSPLVAIGITQLWLYIDQRDLGWVDTDWREKGVPIWLSFAFWQWLAIGLLWTGLGLLYVFTNKK